MRYKKTLISLAILSFSTNSVAIESTGYMTESGLKIIPLLESGYRFDDNYTRIEGGESSHIYDIKPGVAIESNRNGNNYRVAYQMDAGVYSANSNDNYVDHQFATDNFIRFDTRHGLGFNYAFLNQHEARGSGIASGESTVRQLDEALRFNSHQGSATYVYGADNAKGRVEATLDFEDRKYRNFREGSGFNTTYEDYNQVGGDFAMYFGVLPATKLLLQIDHNNRRYDRHDRSNNSQDYIDTYYYTGATWDVTGKTNGMLRFGIQDKSYDSPERTDSNNFSWDLEIEWLPLTYSTITATAGYRNEDAESEEGDVNTSRFSANWKHHWIPNVYSYIDLGYTRQDYTQSSRKDDTTSGSIKLGYEIYEQVDIVAGWSGQHNDSTGAGYTYKQNVWSINANFAF